MQRTVIHTLVIANRCVLYAIQINRIGKFMRIYNPFRVAWIGTEENLKNSVFNERMRINGKGIYITSKGE